MLAHRAPSFKRVESVVTPSSQQTLERNRQGGCGQLVVGALPGAAPDVVAHAITEMKRLSPLLVVKLIREPSEQILNLLAQRKIDLAMGCFSHPLQHNDIDYEVLADESLCVFARRGHPLARFERLDLRWLAQCAWLLQPPVSPARQIMEQEFGQLGMKTPSLYVECTSIFTTLQFVQKSDAVTVLPESVVRDQLQAGLLVRLPVSLGGNLCGLGILTRRGEVLGSAAQQLADVLRGHCATVEGPAMPVTQGPPAESSQFGQVGIRTR
jgi:DNA-binding transcriptional LysR family regulator